jgi:hypothetical protein
MMLSTTITLKISPDQIFHRQCRVFILQASSSPPPPKADVCPTCGVPKNEIAFGCDGSGRIIGGIGAVPGFKWWPIKAYRPCPKATAAGIQYVRKGQDVDTILTGGRGDGRRQ